MIGTLVNTGTIIVGTCIGTVVKKGIKDGYQKTILQAVGLISITLGISWMSKNLASSTKPLLFVLSLIIGGVLGEFLKIEDRVESLKKRFDSGSESNIVDGLVTAILLFCIGTLSILGPIESALKNDHTLLFTNAILDGFTSLILASNFGIGIIISALAIFLWQGGIYMSAGFIAPFITPELMGEVSIIGGVLIMSTGLNILKITKIKTLNLLPALLIPVIYYLPFVKNIFEKIF